MESVPIAWVLPDQSHHKHRGVQSRERCACWKGGLRWLVEECTLAPSPNDKGWFSAETPFPSPSPASARVDRLNAVALVGKLRTDANIAYEPGEGPVQPGGGVLFGTA